MCVTKLVEIRFLKLKPKYYSLVSWPSSWTEYVKTFVVFLSVSFGLSNMEKRTYKSAALVAEYAKRPRRKPRGGAPRAGLLPGGAARGSRASGASGGSRRRTGRPVRALLPVPIFRAIIFGGDGGCWLILVSNGRVARSPAARLTCLGATREGPSPQGPHLVWPELEGAALGPELRRECVRAMPRRAMRKAALNVTNPSAAATSTLSF